MPNQELRDPNEKLSLQLHSLQMKSSIETLPGMSMLMHWQHLSSFPRFHQKITQNSVSGDLHSQGDLQPYPLGARMTIPPPHW